MSHNKNPDPYSELATQIASLVQQLQVSQTLHVDVLFELNIIPYPEFVGEAQDPISWLDDIENAFEANLVQEARKIHIIFAKLKGPAATCFQTNFITKFVTPELKANWFQKLTQRKQIIGERVDDYYVDIAGLIQQLEIGAYQFPEMMKVQIFVKGLHPELSIALAPLTLQTLEEAHTRANAFELAHEHYSLYSVPYPQPINHFSQPSSSKAFTNPLAEQNTHQTIESSQKLVARYETVVDKRALQKEKGPLQNFQSEIGTRKNKDKEFFYYQEASKKRQAYEAYIVGYCYKRGNEVEKDESRKSEVKKENSKEEVDKNNDAINNKLEENKKGTRKDKKNDDINKEMDKKELCKIDVEISEPSKEGKSVKTRRSKGKGISENEDIDKDENNNSWDSDNETVVGNDKKSVEVGNVCNKVWEERVIALVARNQVIPQQNQDNSKDSTSKLAVSILKGEEETKTIRGLQIRTLEYLIL
ncbi:hypothetical protein C2G38_2176385 [Gigaspora rosea]|uniref:Retrotransposon gag domain-containing protein n=1 Tax=Gigaspora rosea TaxID=44941 RepID=A0A397VJJ0_9GLOM|nr:hypothetical protein C2G38_2176385 [Gigaspora rosea]